MIAILTIGFVGNDDKYTILSTESENFVVKKINNSYFENDIDGIIIDEDNDDWFEKTLSWLLLIRKTTSIFALVIYPSEVSPDQIDLLFNLGAMVILPHKSNTVSITYSINNMYNYKNSNPVTYENIFEKYGLTKIENRLVQYLHQNFKKMVSYEYLYEYVWPGISVHNIHEKKMRIANVVKRIREKFEYAEEFEITTIRNKGYIILPYSDTFEWDQ